MGSRSDKPCIKCGETNRSAYDGRCKPCSSKRKRKTSAARRERIRNNYTVAGKTATKDLVSQILFDKKPITREEASDLGYPVFFTNESCSKGHIDVRSMTNGLCFECSRISARKFVKNWDSYTKEEKEIKSKRAHENYIKNKSRVISQVAVWRANNRSYRHRRYEEKVKATPTWLSPFQKWQMDLIYTVRNILNEKSGYTEYHVDHMIPLKGKIVSGLHVPWNLRLLNAEENLRKTNKYEGEYY